VTDLYEAGDVNQTGGGGSAPEFDDEVDGDDDFEDEFDGADDGGDEEGNRRAVVDGGTPLAVLTYLARSRPKSDAAASASTCTWRPTTWAGSSADGAGPPRPSARW